jgi:hypothetical protein
MESTAVTMKKERKPMTPEEKEAFLARMKAGKAAKAALASGASTSSADEPRERSSSPEGHSTSSLLEVEEELATAMAKLTTVESDIISLEAERSALERAMTILREKEQNLKDEEMHLTDFITANQQRLKSLQEAAAAAQEADELPKLKADGTLDMRFKMSRQIKRADGGLDLRFKASKSAIKMGIALPDGNLVAAGGGKA